MLKSIISISGLFIFLSCILLPFIMLVLVTTPSIDDIETEELEALCEDVVDDEPLLSWYTSEPLTLDTLFAPIIDNEVQEPSPSLLLNLQSTKEPNVADEFTAGTQDEIFFELLTTTTSVTEKPILTDVVFATEDPTIVQNEPTLTDADMKLWDCHPTPKRTLKQTLQWNVPIIASSNHHISYALQQTVGIPTSLSKQLQVPCTLSIDKHELVSLESTYDYEGEYIQEFACRLSIEDIIRLEL